MASDPVAGDIADDPEFQASCEHIGALLLEGLREELDGRPTTAAERALIRVVAKAYVLLAMSIAEETAKVRADILRFRALDALGEPNR